MIKFYQLGGWKSESDFPNIKATVEMPQYCFGYVDQAAKTVGFATADNSDENYVFVMQYLYNEVGDPVFWGQNIMPGEYVHCTSVKSQLTRKMDIDAIHITGGIDTNGTLTVAVGDVLVPDGTGNVAVGTAPATGVYLKVVELINLTGLAVRVQVVEAVPAGTP